MSFSHLLLMTAVLLAACTSDDHAVREQVLPVPPAPAYRARLLTNPDGTFGYEINRATKPLIRQLTIPGRAGTAGFRDSVQARAVATLVVRKLTHGLMPPTVTAAELDSLGVR